MSQQSSRSDQSATDKTTARPQLTPAEKILRWSVYIMGLLLIVGMIVVAVTIVKRASKLPVTTRTFEAFDVSVPAGGEVKRLNMDGNRLAIHIGASDGSAGEIIIIDVRKGEVIGRIRLKQ